MPNCILRHVWVVDTIEDRGKKPNGQFNAWKTFAFFSGATFQLAASVVVFGYLGNLLAHRWHHAWVTAVGVVLGVFVGGSGLAFLAKQIMGDKR
ncbi:AtpZ/AtpI family protein [Alicyclobacillus tolerans]|uniref:AtpZ/AtpI family protein n=1 Tax=Alicyclobacillus tolerans TaxID=90970 RepID=UPI001F4106AC|nr:AtpZ/AtpI family protein [Alicyclobacillus tolerans]MCF8567152.1 AtpZ/AtpI family protein [Alicyclobacillus tolerans]